MHRFASTFAGMTATVLLLTVTPPPVFAGPVQAAAGARPECAPTAMAIRALSSGDVGLEFLPLAPTSEGSTLEGTAGDLRRWIPSLGEEAANQFAAYMMKGDDGVYSLTCDWAALGVSDRQPRTMQEWTSRLRIAHPLLTADGREALVFIQGDDLPNSGVQACYLTGGPSAWIVRVCRNVDY